MLGEQLGCCSLIVLSRLLTVPGPEDADQGVSPVHGPVGLGDQVLQRLEIDIQVDGEAWALGAVAIVHELPPRSVSSGCPEVWKEESGALSELYGTSAPVALTVCRDFGAQYSWCLCAGTPCFGLRVARRRAGQPAPVVPAGLDGHDVSIGAEQGRFRLLATGHPQRPLPAGGIVSTAAACSKTLGAPWRSSPQLTVPHPAQQTELQVFEPRAAM